MITVALGESMDKVRVSGVAEIVLNVCDLETMKAFYVDVMGMDFFSESCHEFDEPEKNEFGDPTICFLTITRLNSPLSRSGKHPQLLALIDQKRHLNAQKRFVGHEVQTSTLNHLAFEIAPDSYASHLSLLERLKLQPIESEFPEMQAKAIFFKDPEGNMLELICHAIDSGAA